jgi:hypothetical protein
MNCLTLMCVCVYVLCVCVVRRGNRRRVLRGRIIQPHHPHLLLPYAALVRAAYGRTAAPHTRRLRAARVLLLLRRLRGARVLLLLHRRRSACLLRSLRTTF